MPVKSYADRNGKRKYYAAFYYSDFTGQRRKKKKEGFTTSAAAKQFERDFIELHSGNSEIQFSALVDNYLADCTQRLKGSTVYGKKRIIETHITPFFSAYQVSEITALHVRKWQNEILKKDFKPGYQRMIHAQLAAVLNFAVKYYGLKQNPAALAGSIGTLKRIRPIQFYTLDQFKTFLPCVREKFRLAFRILFYTGVRVGELLALTLADLDAAAGTLRINKTFSHITHTVQPPKTAKSNRIITLPPFLIRELQQYIETLYAPDPDSRLFYWITRRPLSDELARAAKKAGLPVIRIHDFRHSHASLLINLNFPPLVISERLGHESIKTTLEIYSHLYPDKAANVAARLEKLK